MLDDTTHYSCTVRTVLHDKLPMMYLYCVFTTLNESFFSLKKKDKTIKVKTKTQKKQKVGKPHTINSAFYTCTIYK